MGFVRAFFKSIFDPILLFFCKNFLTNMIKLNNTVSSWVKVFSVINFTEFGDKNLVCKQTSYICDNFHKFARRTGQEKAVCDLDEFLLCYLRHVFFSFLRFAPM